MRSSTPMTMDQIRTYAPAVFGDKPWHTCSDRYTHISTELVLNAMLEAGYGVARAQQKHTRTQERMEFTRHLLAFRPLESFGNLSVGDCVPEVVLVNAHDRGAAYSLFCGLYRLICSNGMIVGKTFSGIQVPHRGDVVEQVLAGSKKIWEFLPQLNQWRVEALDTTLSEKRAVKFATEALAIRYGEEQPFDPQRLLHTRRDEDKGMDLWHVYNRVQENLMVGGIEGRSTLGRRTLSRPINRVTKDVIYNRQLWDLATEYKKAA